MHSQVDSLIEQALDLMRQWNTVDARITLKQASDLSRSAGDLFHLLLIELYLARCDYAEHRFAPGLRRAKQASKQFADPLICREDQTRLKAFFFQLQALIAREKGNFSLALSHWMQVLDLAMQQGMNQHTIEACLGIGEIYFLGQHFEQASQVYQLAFSRAATINDPFQLVKAGLHWLQLLMRCEQYEKAQDVCQQIRALIDAQIDPAWRIDLEINEARLLIQNKQPELGLAKLEQLILQSFDLGYYWGAAVIAKLLASLYAQNNQIEQACLLLQKMAKLTEQQGSYCPAELYQIYAELEYQRQHFAEALHQLEKYRLKRGQELQHLHQRSSIMTPSRQRLLDLTLENLLLKQQLIQVQHAQ